MTVLKRVRKHSPPDLYLSRKSSYNSASNLLLEGIQAGGGVFLNAVKQATTHTRLSHICAFWIRSACLAIYSPAETTCVKVCALCWPYHCVTGSTECLPYDAFSPILPHNQTSRPIGLSLNSIPRYHQLSVTPFQQWYAHSAPRPLLFVSSLGLYCLWSFWPNRIFWRGTKLIRFNNCSAIILIKPLFFIAFLPPLFQSSINEFKGATIWVFRSGWNAHTRTHTHKTETRIKIQKVGPPLLQHYCSLKHIYGGILVLACAQRDFRVMSI